MRDNTTIGYQECELVRALLHMQTLCEDACFFLPFVIIVVWFDN